MKYEHFIPHPLIPHVSSLILHEDTATRWDTFPIIPRMDGVSFSSTVLFIFVSPMPRNTLRCFSGRPIMLLTSVTFSTVCSSLSCKL